MSRPLAVAFVTGAVFALFGATGAEADDASATGANPTARTVDLPGDAEGLVRALGDDSFAVREQASFALVRMGVPAKEALLAGLKSDDAEIRFRCRRALAEVLDVEFYSNLDRFSRGDRSPEVAPPGWAEFRAVAGENDAAREMFVAMQRDEPALMQDWIEAPQNVSELLAQRCQTIQQEVFAPRGQQRRQIRIGSFAAMLFVASREDVYLADRTSAYLHSFSYQQSFQQSVQQGPMVGPLRALLGAWIARGTDSQTKNQNFMLALQYDLREGLKPALTALKSGSARPHVLQYALRVVGKFGDADTVQHVVPFLESAAVCGRQRVQKEEVRTQVRDVALAVLLHLTNQNYVDYGFDRLRRDPRLLFRPGTLGFQSESARQDALYKWKTWAEANAG